MSKDRFTLPAAVFLVLLKDDKTLLMRRANTGWHDGDFDFVAGHIDGNESLKTALAREAHEEIGISILADDIMFAHLIHGLFEDGKEYFNIFFTVTTWTGEPTIMEPNKCDRIEWFRLDNLPANLTESTKRGIEALKTNSPYSNFGFSS
jgi:8-oxo-dGTP diphosphatase